MEKIPTILVIATLDTKARECQYIKDRIETSGCRALVMDTGTLNDDDFGADITRDDVARAAGTSMEELRAANDKGKCVRTMMAGAAAAAKRLHDEGKLDGVLGIGGAQGTDIGTSAMRGLPFGVPKFMVSTVASGQAIFGPYVDTKDIIMMHSVADIQGINFLTREVFDNAAAAVCGMAAKKPVVAANNRPAVGLSMLGTTTAGAMRAHQILDSHGYDVVAFHQNGTGGISLEDLIREGRFVGVLDINLHEIGDRVAGGMHGSIRDYRLTAAAELGIPQVIAPGSVNYAVWGPEKTVSPELKKRKYIIHNPQLTLVRISPEELVRAAEIVAERVSRCTGPVHFYMPLRGFSFPDREGGPHWEPETNELFIKTIRKNLDPRIPYDEFDLHVNDPAFIDVVADGLLAMLKKR